MRITMDKYYDANGYYLVIGDKEFSRDDEIAQYLNLSIEEYRSIIASNIAVIPNSESDEIIFKYKDITPILEALEPYIIIVELTE